MTDKYIRHTDADGNAFYVKYDDNGDGYYTPVTVGPALVSSTDTNCGQITVTTAGTAVQGPDVALVNGVFINSHPSNTGLIAVGNDGTGDITTTNGYILGAGSADLWQVQNLNQLWFDASVNGEKACWHKA